MKRLILIVLVLTGLAVYGLFRISGSNLSTAQARASAGIEQPLQSPTPLPTSSPEPRSTATIGLGATAAAAQLTANAALSTAESAHIELAHITSAAEERTHEEQMAEIALQQSSVNLEHTKVSGTQTAAPTAIPGTQTQAWVENWIVESRSTLESARITATAEAPALIREIKLAENYGTLKLIEEWAKLLIGVGICIGSVALIWLVRVNAERTAATRQLVELEQARDGERWRPLSQDDRDGIKVSFKIGSRAWHDIMPCDQNMLLEFADRVCTGETLGVNKWEGSETIWTREDFNLFLDFLVRNHLAVKPQAENQSHKLTKNGELYFRLISSNGDTPPPQYEFGHDITPPTNGNAHMSMTHTDFDSGEVVSETHTKH